MIKKTFQDPVIWFIEFKVTIADDAVFITRINKLDEEYPKHSTIEVPREVFERIIEFYQANKETDLLPALNSSSESEIFGNQIKIVMNFLEKITSFRST